MPFDETNHGILAGLSGLTQGIVEGLKLRRDWEDKKETVRLKQEEIDIKKASEESKTKYFTSKNERETAAASRQQMLAESIVSTRKEMTSRGRKSSDLAAIREATDIDAQINKVIEKKGRIDKNLSYLTKPEQRKPLEDQSSAYASQLQDLRARKSSLQPAVKSTSPMDGEFSGASSLEDIVAIANRIELKNPGVDRAEVKAAANRRFENLGIENLMKPSKSDEDVLDAAMSED